MSSCCINSARIFSLSSRHVRHVVDTAFIDKLPQPKKLFPISSNESAPDDVELHSHWKSLEKRLLHRKHVKRVDMTAGSRSSLNKTAWDAGDNGYEELYTNNNITSLNKSDGNVDSRL